MLLPIQPVSFVDITIRVKQVALVVVITILKGAVIHTGGMILECKSMFDVVLKIAFIN